MARTVHGCLLGRGQNRLAGGGSSTTALGQMVETRLIPRIVRATLCFLYRLVSDYSAGSPTPYARNVAAPISRLSPLKHPSATAAITDRQNSLTGSARALDRVDSKP